MRCLVHFLTGVQISTPTLALILYPNRQIAGESGGDPSAYVRVGRDGLVVGITDVGLSAELLRWIPAYNVDEATGGIAANNVP